MKETGGYLFVYGTLMRSFRHPVGELLRTHTEFAGEATTQGMLYHFGAYPGLVVAGHEHLQVIGELYRFDHALSLSADRETLLLELDDYEGCGPYDPKPYLFIREKLLVNLQDGQTLTAWSYIYNLNPARGVPIAEGRFKG